jgi:hypothetical protein
MSVLRVIHGPPEKCVYNVDTFEENFDGSRHP